MVRKILNKRQQSCPLNYTDKITLLFALYSLLYSLIDKQFPKSVSFLTRTIISGFLSIYNAYTGLIKTKINSVRAEMLIAVTNKIKVFYILIQCSVVRGYQRSDRILCLFRLGKYISSLNTETAETLIPV